MNHENDMINEKFILGEHMKEQKPRGIWRIIPKHAVLPLISAFGFNTFVFNGTRVINKNRKYHNMTTKLDKKLPFVPGMVIIYVLAFVQWIVGYIVVARDDKKTLKRVVGADLVAKGITLGCFLAVPTEMERPAIDGPELSGKGFTKWLTRFIYKADAANNLFPSIHCLESWMIYKSTKHLKKKVPFWYKPVMFVMSVLVFASTVLLKQHVVVDIPAGVAAAEAGYKVMDKVMK